MVYNIFTFSTMHALIPLLPVKKKKLTPKKVTELCWMYRKRYINRIQYVFHRRTNRHCPCTMCKISYAFIYVLNVFKFTLMHKTGLHKKYVNSKVRQSNYLEEIDYDEIR